MIIKRPYRFPAGALQFAILLSVVIAVIVGAFLLLTYTRLQFTQKAERATDVYRWAQEGIVMATQQRLPYNKQIAKTRPEDSRAVIELEKTHWGLYDKVSSRAILENDERKIYALLGGGMKKETRPALYLQDTNSPLIVVGDTQIKGTAFVPELGVKPGSIKGKYYTGERLIYGTQKQSKEQLPQIDPQKINYFKGLLDHGVPETDSLYVALDQRKPVTHSFSTVPQWYYQSGVINLSHQNVANNIIIKSDTLIRVSAFAKANNVILVAPKIEIAAKFKGQVQAIASQMIRVGINAELVYPSSLVVVVDKATNTFLNQNDAAHGIVLQQRSQMTGSLLYINEYEQITKTPTVLIEKEAVLKGDLYCNQQLSLEGLVKGSVYTKQFVTHTAGALYMNHFLDGSINSHRLEASFVGIAHADTENQIMQWLDE